MGRRSEMPSLVARVKASPEARERVKVVLLTLAGQWSVKDALERLDLGRTRFQDLRREMLDAAGAALESGAAGRPTRSARREARQVRSLREHIAALTHELRVLRAQVDLHESGLGERMPNRLELAGGVR